MVSMTTWAPDSCDCILEFDNNIKWIKSDFKCNLHNNLRGQKHLDAVITHNQSFNLRFGRIVTEDNEKLIIQDKKAERLRIRAI